MTDRKPTRQERLAAKLRDNLRLRKAQSRAMNADGKPVDGALPNSEVEG